MCGRYPAQAHGHAGGSCKARALPGARRRCPTTSPAKSSSVDGGLVHVKVWGIVRNGKTSRHYRNRRGYAGWQRRPHHLGERARRQDAALDKITRFDTSATCKVTIAAEVKGFRPVPVLWKKPRCARRTCSRAVRHGGRGAGHAGQRPRGQGGAGAPWAFTSGHGRRRHDHLCAGDHEKLLDKGSEGESPPSSSPN